MIERKISKDILQSARDRVDKFSFGKKGKSFFGSERHRTLIGYIGELMVMEYLKVEHVDDEFDFDIIYKAKKLEIKSISCKFRPHLDYLCTVNSYDLDGVHQQESDYYVFTRIINQMTKGWILRYIGCKEFFKRGEFIKKGSIVVPGVKFWKANATVLPINQLNSIETIKKL